MPTVTIHGEKAIEVEPGKKLVLAIEDAAIDILHRCGGNARCTTCRVEVLDGTVTPMAEAEKERLGAKATSPQYPAILSDPRRVGRGGQGHQPLAAGRDSPRTATRGLSRTNGRAATAAAARLARTGRARIAEPRPLPCAAASDHLFFCFSEHFLQRAAAAADLGAAPRTTVELGLTRLLLSGAERHGIPRSGSLSPLGRCPAGDPPLSMVMHPARAAGSRFDSLPDHPAAVLEGLRPRRAAAFASQLGPGINPAPRAGRSEPASGRRTPRRSPRRRRRP